MLERITNTGYTGIGSVLRSIEPVVNVVTHGARAASLATRRCIRPEIYYTNTLRNAFRNMSAGGIHACRIIQVPHTYTIEHTATQDKTG